MQNYFKRSTIVPLTWLFDLLKKVLFIYLVLERGEEEEREEKHECVKETLSGCLSQAPSWDLSCKPGMCPDWDSNPQPFCL